MLNLPPLKTIDEIDFKNIVDTFTPPKKNKFKVPRIAFIGYFRHLSMSWQREICMHLGFEHYGEIKFDTSHEKKNQLIASKWSEIFEKHTKLVVLGNDYLKMPGYEFEIYFNKQLKKHKRPLVFELDIPVMMEEELWKIHVDYPEISNNTRWEKAFIKSEYLSG